MGLTNADYDSLMRTYDERQARDAEDQARRIRHAEAEIPRLREIRAEISDLGYEAALGRVESSESSSKKDSSEDLSRRIKALMEERASLLKKNGLPADYLEMRYVCPDCKDTGYIGGERCHCFRQAAIDLVYQQSHIEEHLGNKSFRDFSLDFYSDSHKDGDVSSPRDAAKRALEIMKHFASSVPQKPESILLYGETGTGKTLLTNCAARSLLNRGVSVIYFTAFQFFDIAEKKVFDHDHSIDGDYDNIFSCEVLIIDDLGTEMKNSFTASQCFQIVNERLLRGLSTIITTNLSLPELREVYGERVFSRIAGNYTLIKLFGDDVRLQKKLNN